MYAGQGCEPLNLHPGGTTNGFAAFAWFMPISRQNVLPLPHVLPMEADAASGIPANTRTKGRKKGEADEANEKPPAAVFTGRGCENPPALDGPTSARPPGPTKHPNTLKLDFP